MIYIEYLYGIKDAQLTRLCLRRSEYEAKLKYYELIYDSKFMTDLKNTNCGRLDNPSTIF